MRRLIRAILGRDYEIREAEDGDEALRIANEWNPDVVLLDIMMPRMNGFEACRALKSQLESRPPQVIMVTSASAMPEQIAAFEAGADDYLVKPVDRPQLQSRVQLHFRLREAQSIVEETHQNLALQRTELQRMTIERNREMIATQDVAIFTLAKVAESRDNETGMHLFRMREYSQCLARQLRAASDYCSQIDERFMEDLYRSSPLHDIGKVGIPDSVLLKPGKLSPGEFGIMKQHATIGADILDEAVRQSPSGGFLGMAAVIARSHHERWDGQGYPAGLAGSQIPLPGRIVAVADVFDALTSRRPYKEPWPVETARAYVEEGAGKHFDPTVVEAFRQSFREFVAIQQKFADDDTGTSAYGQLTLSLIAASSAEPVCAPC